MLLLRNLVINKEPGKRKESGYKAPACRHATHCACASPLILCRLRCKMNRFALGRTGTRTVVGQADSDLSQRSRLLQALTDGDNPDKAAPDAFDFLTSLGAPKGISSSAAQTCECNICRPKRKKFIGYIFLLRRPFHCVGQQLRRRWCKECLCRV